jgi:hypothetical protein
MHSQKCRRAAELDVKRLVEVHGAEMVLKALQPNCTCDNCGARWPDIDVEVPPRSERKAPIGSSP